MPLKPGTATFTLLLALLTSLGPLSTDMYLPSLPSIVDALETDTPSVQLTLSVFLTGFAVGQLLYGPFADRYGRKPVLLAGLALFIAGSLLCAVAPGITTLLAARFLQALGACSAVVMSRAIVRDLFAASEAARMLSFMGALMGLVPATAPMLGGVLQTTFGWRASFVATTIGALAIFAFVYLALPETLKPEMRAPWSLRGMISDFGRLLRSGTFLRFALAVAFGYAALFSFISGSSFVLQGLYGLSEIGFGFSFSLCVIGYISGTLTGARVTRHIGIARTVAIGSTVLAAGGIAMALMVTLLEPAAWHVLVPMLAVMAGVGLVLPQSTAGAITPFPERAGTASSLLGFLQMTFAALVGILVGHAIEFDARALAYAIATMSVANLALTLAAARRAPT